MKKWFEQNWSVILLFLVAISVIITLVYYLVDNTRKIDDQRTALVQSERNIGTDFSKLRELDNVALYFNGDTFTAVYNSEDCRLSVTYNQKLEVVSRQLEDLRIIKNPYLFLGRLLYVAMATTFIGIILIFLVAWFFDIKQKRQIKVLKS